MKHFNVYQSPEFNFRIMNFSQDLFMGNQSIFAPLRNGCISIRASIKLDLLFGKGFKWSNYYKEYEKI